MYARFAPAVHRRALSLLGRDADAWDAVQEVFERMLQARDDFRGQARPMTYVYRVTTNVCLNLLRRRSLRDVPGTAEAVAEEAVAPRSVESAQLLRLLVRKLTGREQEIAVLHFLDGLTQEEIAEVLGVSRKTVVRDLAHLREVAAALEGPVGGRSAGNG